MEWRLATLILAAAAVEMGDAAAWGARPAAVVLSMRDRAPPPPKKKPGKVRIDDLLVSRGVVAERKGAQALILAGNVFVNSDQKVQSGAMQVCSCNPIYPNPNPNESYPTRTPTRTVST